MQCYWLEFVQYLLRFDVMYVGHWPVHQHQWTKPQEKSSMRPCGVRYQVHWQEFVLLDFWSFLWWFCGWCFGSGWWLHFQSTYDIYGCAANSQHKYRNVHDYVLNWCLYSLIHNLWAFGHWIQYLVVSLVLHRHHLGYRAPGLAHQENWASKYACLFPGKHACLLRYLGDGGHCYGFLFRRQRT